MLLSLCCMLRMCCHVGKLSSLHEEASGRPLLIHLLLPTGGQTSLSRVLGLPAELLLPHAMDADLTWNLFRLWTVMQSGTPVGQERQYSWKPTAGRLVVTTPPAGDASDDQQASSATPLADSLDFKDSESHRTRRAGMQTRLPGRPRPTMASRLLAEATTQKRPSYAARSPDGPTGYSAGTEPDGPATPLPRKRALRTMQMTASRKALRTLSELTPPATARRRQAARTPHGTRIPHHVVLWDTPVPRPSSAQIRTRTPRQDPWLSMRTPMSLPSTSASR